jgi:stage II sporulation protein M
MTLKKLMDNFNKHFRDNFWIYLITILFLSTGAILGIYSVKYMSDSDKNSLINYITSLSKSTTLESINNKAIFIEAIKSNLPIIIGYWFLGLTIVGIPVILILSVFKGFSIGFTISFFIHSLKDKGLILAILGVLPQNIIYIPCIILASVLSIQFSLSMLRDKVNKNYKGCNENSIVNYTLCFIVFIIVMVTGFLLEAFITPNLIRFALKTVGV